MSPHLTVVIKSECNWKKIFVLCSRDKAQIWNEDYVQPAAREISEIPVTPTAYTLQKYLYIVSDCLNCYSVQNAKIYEFNLKKR